MEIRPCRECRRLFNYLTGVQICPGCREKLEEKYYEVKQFLQENPNMTIAQVAESCDVRMTQITQWVREGRLELSQEAGVDVRCERCGEVVRIGQLCDKCKQVFLTELKEIESSFKTSKGSDDIKKDGARMRFARH